MLHIQEAASSPLGKLSRMSSWRIRLASSVRPLFLLEPCEMSFVKISAALDCDREKNLTVPIECSTCNHPQELAAGTISASEHEQVVRDFVVEHRWWAMRGH